METVQPQKIFWGVNEGLPAGAYIEHVGGIFIPWATLKTELETQVLPQCSDVFPANSTLRTNSFHGKEDWVVEIIDEHAHVVGSVWIGSDPYNNWKQDGAVRVGLAKSDTEWIVHHAFERFSDGTYVLVKN